MKDADSDNIWKALADPTRRKVLDLLKEKPATTGQLCEHFPEVSRFAVMKHLKVLTDAGLVVVRWEGKFRWNHINQVPIQQIYERWVSKHAMPLTHSLSKLKDHVENKRNTDARRVQKHPHRARNFN